MRGPEACPPHTFFPGIENYLASLRALSANPDATPEYIEFLKQLAEASQKFGETGHSPIPEILSQPEPFNYGPYFEAISTPDGDERLPSREMWMETLNYFQPRIAAYQAYVSTGGCELKDGYICDGYGRKILAWPENSCPPEDLRKVITPEEVKQFIDKQIDRYKNKNIEWFVGFLQKKSQDTGLPIQLYTISSLYLFFAALNSPNASGLESAIVYRHYYDTRESVAGLLGLVIQEYTETSYPPSLITQLIDIASPSRAK